MRNMTATRLKGVMVKLALGGVMLLLLSPLYMYFSYDAESLIKKYPHIQESKNSVSFKILPERPKEWVRLKEISKYARWAIVLSEDWGFYQHQGIDVEQIRAALNEMVDGSRFRGASTITQQMVKNVYLSEDRTLWRKVHEIILAQKVEMVLSKERILEIYLNCIEYGPGIYGISEAARHYFKKRASELTPVEGAYLAMLLPSPKRYYVSFKNRRLTKFARSRINAILAKMRMAKVISRPQYEILRIKKLSFER